MKHRWVIELGWCPEGAILPMDWTRYALIGEVYAKYSEDAHDMAVEKLERTFPDARILINDECLWHVTTLDTEFYVFCHVPEEEPSPNPYIDPEPAGRRGRR